MDVKWLGRYTLSLAAGTFEVRCPEGTGKFSGLASSRLPKIYVASADGMPFYVGITKQPMRDRLRFGWSAKGDHGYYGYAWRDKFEKVALDVWCHVDPPNETACRDVETIEAEVVFLIRDAGQWPLFQTEIHFHPSSEEHRKVARLIASNFKLGQPDEEKEALRSA